MEEDFINQGSKLQKLDYSQLVFLQINRLGQQITNYNSGDLDRAVPVHGAFDKKFKTRIEENIEFGLSFLQSMIVYQLNEKDREQYFEERKSAYVFVGRFDLLMKYLPKTNIMPAKRKTLETLEE